MASTEVTFFVITCIYFRNPFFLCDILRNDCVKFLIDLAKSDSILESDQVENYLKIVKYLKDENLKFILSETENLSLVNSSSRFASNLSLASMTSTASNKPNFTFAEKLRYITAIRLKNFEAVQNIHLDCKLLHENSHLVDFNYEILKNLFVNNFKNFIWLVENNDKVNFKIAESGFLEKLVEEMPELGGSQAAEMRKCSTASIALETNLEQIPNSTTNLNEINFLKSFIIYQSHEIYNKIDKMYQKESMGIVDFVSRLAYRNSKVGGNKGSDEKEKTSSEDRNNVKTFDIIGLEQFLLSS